MLCQYHLVKNLEYLEKDRLRNKCFTEARRMMDGEAYNDALNWVHNATDRQRRYCMHMATRFILQNQGHETEAIFE